MYICFASIAISSCAITKPVSVDSVSVSSHPPDPCEIPCSLPDPALVESGAVTASSFNVMCTSFSPGTYSILASMGTCCDPFFGFALVADAILRDLWTRPSGFSCSVKHTYLRRRIHRLLMYTGAPEVSHIPP